MAVAAVDVRESVAMASHELPTAVIDHIAADRLRRRCLELHDALAAMEAAPGPFDIMELLEWAGRVDVTLLEVARG
jgi:hypothetical protein